MSRECPTTEGASPKYTIGELFSLSLETEELARELYHRFTSMFRHLPEIAAFWEDLANDEAMHISAPRRARSTLLPEDLAGPAPVPLFEDLRSLKNILTGERLRSTKTLDDAYEQAHDFEYSEVNHVYTLLMMKHVSSESRKLFIKSEIERHHRKLVDFTLVFGDRGWRRGVEAGSGSV